MSGPMKAEGNIHLTPQHQKRGDNPKQADKVSTTGTNDGTTRLVQDMALFKDLLDAIRNSKDKETWELLKFIKAGARPDEIRQHMEDRGLVYANELDSELN